MSSHVHSLKVGDKITVIGPKGKITYHGHGEFGRDSGFILSSSENK